MPSAPRRPRLVVVSAHDPVTDVQLQAVALAAARDGWAVTLVAPSAGRGSSKARLGPVRIRRVAVGRAHVRAEEQRRQLSPVARLLRAGAGAGAGEVASLSARTALRRSRARLRSAKLAGPVPGAHRIGLRVLAQLDRAILAAQTRTHTRRRRPDDEKPLGDWRRDHPTLLDLDLALGPVLERLRPDVIHADGAATLPTAAVSVARLRAAGHPVRWVYGAREHAATTTWPTRRLGSALTAVEREYAGRADAVVAMTSAVAQALEGDPALGVRPVLLANEARPTAVDWSLLARLYRELTGLAPRRRPAVKVGARPRPVLADPKAARDLPWRALGNTRVRLGMGMANYAGQLSAQAQALTAEHDDVSVEVVTRTTGKDFSYLTDVQVPLERLADLDWQLEQLRRVLPRYTHLVADAFLPVFGTLNGSDVAADLPAITGAGIEVALLAHGSEVRDPLRHRERSPYSLFHDAPPELLETLVRTTARNREIAATAGLPVFVTTPDLLDELPGSRWVPLVVDVDAWHCDRPVLARSRPVVLHAPSARWTKGTDRFLPDLEAMHERGVIELRLLEGVPWATMREMVQDADVVIDQVAIGSYGAFACEAMAAGKPVVAHVTDAVVDAIGEQPPLVNTPPDQVARTLADLLDDRESAAATGRAAADYARRVHGGRRTAEVLWQWLAT